ncbi:hypothetical protein NDU88_006876 [Pleurodeles waltl]|uniref:Uncharacterized protein n=1 Tax=Pleurodeles waltl TaxID=8319 RepID=A0AAV7NRI9_PLEWA|nr:hypothetical protein NDU88_006876 [Pleurodeles waltl]
MAALIQCSARKDETGDNGGTPATRGTTSATYPCPARIAEPDSADFNHPMLAGPQRGCGLHDACGSNHSREPTRTSDEAGSRRALSPVVDYIVKPA